MNHTVYVSKQQKRMSLKCQFVVSAYNILDHNGGYELGYFILNYIVKLVTPCLPHFIRNSVLILKNFNTEQLNASINA